MMAFDTIKPLADDDRLELNSFVSSRAHAPFLQSYEWGEFQKALGRRVERIGVLERESGHLVGSALFIRHTLPFGKYYWYCPRGPVCPREDVLQALFEHFVKYNGIFLRVDPLNKQTVIQERAIKNIQPAHTLVLDLFVEEDALLAQMRQKTRYNIRLAQKKGVEVRCYAKPSSENMQEFINLVAVTSLRHGIKAHADFYYETMLKSLGAPSSQGLYANLFTAYARNKPIASNIVLFFGDTATYLHGGSQSSYKELMSPHLLQWESIQKAQEKGYRYYDLWGIAPPGAGGHSWKGITRFKTGFGGEVISYPCAFDVPFQKKWYYLYRIARKIM